jgi:RNA polymerase sigma-70 factor (ECF subfamily)
VTVERDQRLVEAARGGDAAAFEELYRLHRDTVLRLAYRWTGSHDDAEDVLQEAFAYVLGKLAGLTLTGRLSTLLYPVVKHLARDARKRRGRFASEEEALGGLAAPEGEGPRDALAAALALLPEHQREVLLLRTVEGFALEEIAAALGIPLGTVKSRLHLALATLREDPRTRRYFEA